MDDMTATSTAPSPRHGQRDKWDWLLRLIVVLTALLVPLCFYELFRVTYGLLYPYIGERAWIVPAAVEGGFLIAFLLGLWLQHKHKPQAWLRWIPYGFAAASLFIQLWASHGVPPAMIANAAVTAAFFLPLIAAERAVKSLAVSDADVRLIQERADAMRYARDLMRDRKGPLWRYRVPSLLRAQILHDRPPAAVMAAVREGASFGGAVKWEEAVEKWIADGLNQGVRMAATVERQRAVIEASVAAPSDAGVKPQPARQPARKPAVSGRDRVRQILTEDPHMPLLEVAQKAGVSKSTVERVKREMPTPLRVARG
jgi:hypothetical protein